MESKSFVTALHDKYSCDEPLAFEILMPKSAPGKTDSGELLVPSHLGLNSCNISHAGDEDEICKVCSGVCELDLADNCLNDWEEVYKILQQMPKVSFLNVSANSLGREPDIRDKEFPNLRKLVLNSVELTWGTLKILLTAMPKLYEVHLSLNNFGCVDETICEQPHPNITQLYFSGNNIKDWTDISKLGQAFPQLESLVVAENPLSELPSDPEQVAAHFPCLTCLNVSKTQISSWPELEKLRSFPNLTDIRMQGIPLLQGYEEKIRRQLVIGYLSNVMRLNASRISEEERETAERAFIRHYMDQDDRPPRYEELSAVYGKLDPLVEVDLKPSNSVSVLVTFGDKTQLRTLNIHKTLTETKKLLSDFAGLPPRKFFLYHAVSGNLYGQDIMKYPNRTLLGYRVMDGDSIHIELQQPLSVHIV